MITKLRSATSVESQQYRKAAKALLVLIPLLGVTHVLVIAGPTQGISRNIYDSIRAGLLSTQVKTNYFLKTIIINGSILGFYSCFILLFRQY